MIVCSVLTITINPDLLLFLYTAFFISYAGMVYCVVSFVQLYSTLKKRDVFQSPLFYGNIGIILILLYNLYSRNMFMISKTVFLGAVFPTIRTRGMFFMFYAFIIMESAICVLYLFSGAIKSARIYRSRYILIILDVVSHILIYILFTYLGLPEAVKTIIILPEWIIILYVCGYYSTRKLTSSVLNFVTDNQANGLMIYDENDFLIYRNKMIDEILTPDQISAFYNKDALDKWSQELDEYNGLYVKTIEVDGKNNYYNIFKHEFHDKNSYIGASFSFQNFTESFERFAMVEEANEELKRAAHMKSDFLANMSHEIRTPMNAVIGLAEMALREDMTEQARDYISQIKSSGRNLLNIINDILDFSKIESGKMDIIPEPYEPLSEFNDVGNTLMTRVGEKDIELTLEENPAIPHKLEGDVLRIRQILINLANNAIKFTHHGRVQILADYSPISEDEIMLRFHVVDTGQGIKKEDLKKLFVSFQQVDAKRNRSIEGTGLGLAISKSLVEAMGGTIGVDSEYGKGSDFYFEIPQKVIDPTPSITVDNPEKIFAFGMFNKKYLARRFFIDTSRMGVYSAVLRFYDDYDTTCDLYEDMLENRRRYIFFEYQDYKDQIRELLLNDPDLIGVMLADYTSAVKPDLNNLRIIKKPFSTAAIAMALNNLVLHLNSDEGNAFATDFTAPDAKILIVDDNMVNLTVAEGLLEPLKMEVVCVVSGKDAIDKINTQKFDIVFMDHMMPEMDGVETTRVIRRMYPELDDMPIIALTANAVSGVKEFFLKEGMNDFVPKPIEVRDLMSKVKQWLPPDKIKKSHEIVSIENEAEENINISGLDTEKAISMIGSSKLYMKILKEYYKNIEVNHKQLEEAFESEDWEDYTIKVHALKSSSRQIGATDLAEKAAALEAAGKASDIEFIKNNNDEALSQYIGLVPMLKDVCGDEGEVTEKPLIEKEKLFEIMHMIETACDDLDMDAMENIVTELNSYSYDPSIEEDIKAIIESAELMDVFTCNDIAQKLLDM